MNKMHIRFLVEETHQADTSASHSIPQMAAAVEAGDPSRRDDVKIGFGNSSKADVAGGAVSEEDSEAASPAGENAKSFDESGAKIFACSKCGKQFAKARYLTQHRLDSNADASFSCTPWSTATRNHISVKSAKQRSSLRRISSNMARPILKCGLMSVPIAVRVLSGEAR
ncbi:hypothetical protein HDU78_003588 [Chytriomyces hyalinus]|nr:hypothetical protein HDU78_003588 [Chytriomyces hyalinus]